MLKSLGEAAAQGRETTYDQTGADDDILQQGGDVTIDCDTKTILMIHKGEGSKDRPAPRSIVHPA